ncbi:MAG: beta-galactosidase [Anaerolineales bacterium]|nr:beta-galactosidase [Anaerolineales bacterium]
MTEPTAGRLQLGAAWYPEHWPTDRWPEDIHLMKAAGLTVVRMAEFAWSRLEPAEGKFDFAWLEQAIAGLAEHGIASVLGTPTAAPPAWLVQDNPASLAMGSDGRRIQFGNRCHYCVNAGEFHTASKRIVQAMARKFGPNPHVIGWQLDNEYSRVCYCDTCQAEFHKFLETRYGTLENLNARWTTAYWSQTYSTWDQIPLPVGAHNPGLMLEFKRFVGASYLRYQKLQLDVLRPHLKASDWVTHNFMGWFGGFDHYLLSADLDLASWDWYIGTGHHDHLTTGAIHDLTRGFKRRNFWLMETQPGNVNWSPVNNSLNKGEARAMAWHAVAHGAEAVLYWQWRSALGGQEQYHGTLIDQSGQPRPFYDEVRQLGAEFSVVSDLLAGSEVLAEVALLNDYPSRWSIEAQKHHQDFDYVAHLTHYYRPLATRNVAVDILPADTILSGQRYRIVFAPALLILDEARAGNLIEYVKSGGTLVLTIRTGVKDKYNALLPSRPPGPLAGVAGAEVEEYYALERPVPVHGDWFAGVSRQWAERLGVISGSCSLPVATFRASNGWLDDQPAVVVHAIPDQGTVYTLGVYLDEKAQQDIIDHILAAAGLRTIKTPPGIEVRTRLRPDGQEIHFIINHNPGEQSVRLPWPAHDHLSGQDVRGNTLLPPYGVLVLTRGEQEPQTARRAATSREAAPSA